MSNAEKSLQEGEKRIIDCDILSPEDLIIKIDSILKTCQEVLKFQGTINSVSDLKLRGGFLCIFLLRNELLPELVNLLIDNSLQNGFEYGIDINESGGNGYSLINYVIDSYEYELFIKLLKLNVNIFGTKEITPLNSVVAGGGMKKLTNEAIEIRRSMMKDLLELGAIPDKHTLKNIIIYMDSSFLYILANHESSNELLTASNIKIEMTDSSNQYLFERNPKIQTALMVIYNKKRIIETIEKKVGEDEVETAVKITKDELKERIKKIITSPEYLAQIIEEVDAEYGDKLDEAIVEGVKNKRMENPQALLEKIFR